MSSRVQTLETLKTEENNKYDKALLILKKDIRTLKEKLKKANENRNELIEFTQEQAEEINALEDYVTSLSKQFKLTKKEKEQLMEHIKEAEKQRDKIAEDIKPEDIDNEDGMVMETFKKTMKGLKGTHYKNKMAELEKRFS